MADDFDRFGAIGAFDDRPESPPHPVLLTCEEPIDPEARELWTAVVTLDAGITHGELSLEAREVLARFDGILRARSGPEDEVSKLHDLFATFGHVVAAVCRRPFKESVLIRAVKDSLLNFLEQPQATGDANRTVEILVAMAPCVTHCFAPSTVRQNSPTHRRFGAHLARLLDACCEAAAQESAQERATQLTRAHRLLRGVFSRIQTEARRLVAPTLDAALLRVVETFADDDGAMGCIEEALGALFESPTTLNHEGKGRLLPALERLPAGALSRHVADLTWRLFDPLGDFDQSSLAVAIIERNLFSLDWNDEANLGLILNTIDTVAMRLGHDLGGKHMQILPLCMPMIMRFNAVLPQQLGDAERLRGHQESMWQSVIPYAGSAAIVRDWPGGVEGVLERVALAYAHPAPGVSSYEYTREVRDAVMSMFDDRHEVGFGFYDSWPNRYPQYRTGAFA